MYIQCKRPAVAAYTARCRYAVITRNPNYAAACGRRFDNYILDIIYVSITYMAIPRFALKWSEQWGRGDLRERERERERAVCAWKRLIPTVSRQVLSYPLILSFAKSSAILVSYNRDRNATKSEIGSTKTPQLHRNYENYKALRDKRKQISKNTTNCMQWQIIQTNKQTDRENCRTTSFIGGSMPTCHVIIRTTIILTVIVVTFDFVIARVKPVSK